MTATLSTHMPRRSAPRAAVDTEWFMERIRESRYGSQLQLAPEIMSRQGPLDQTGLSRRLRGERDFTIPELVQLARLLRVDLREVLVRVGVPRGDL